LTKGLGDLLTTLQIRVMIFAQVFTKRKGILFYPLFFFNSLFDSNIN